MKTGGYHFQVNVETNNRTGEVMAVYFKVREGMSHKVKEYEKGNVFADYDRKGRLLGIEMLAPCQAQVLDRIAEHAPVRRFVKNSVPNAMLIAT